MTSDSNSIQTFHSQVSLAEIVGQSQEQAAQPQATYEDPTTVSNQHFLEFSTALW